MIDLKKYTVYPGQFMITSVPALISTVLGSCVSVCLWDSQTGLGAMNHYLLPGTSDDEAGNANRGITSIPMLFRSMVNRRVNLGTLEAKVFGGCNSLYQNNNLFKVGERNIAIAMNILNEYGIRISAHHVGGPFGRKIVFNTSTGRVRMRLLVKTATEINEEIHKGFGY